MKREDILKLAREQGLPETATEGVFIVNTDDLGRVLSAEREACAKLCISIKQSQPLKNRVGWEHGTIDCSVEMLIKETVKKCAEIADIAEPYQSADLILKHFGVEE